MIGKAEIQREAIEQHFEEHKPRKLRAIIYCRVSTDKQELDGDSLEFQEDKCRRYCELHDIEIVTVLKETKSGFIHYSLREKLSIARQMIRDKVADLIIVWDLRRFSRNFVYSALIFQEIEEAGGSVISVSENIDNSLTGQLIRAILSWSAESERHKYVEYANRRWQSRRELNLPVGTGSAPYGWAWADKEKTGYVIDLEKAAVLFSIFHMYVEMEMSLRSIAHKLTADRIAAPRGPQRRRKKASDMLLPEKKQEAPEEETEKKQPGVWNCATVRRILKDPRTVGILTICQTKVVITPDGRRTQQPHPERKEIPGGIPAILTDKDVALYARAQEKLATNQQNLSKLPEDPETFLLRGHVYCNCCGNKMRTRTFHRGTSQTLYLCNPRTNKYVACTNQQAIRTSPLNEIVWTECCQLFERLERVKACIEQKMEEEIRALLEHGTGREQVLQMETELEAARAEQQKHPKKSYVYEAISRDIARREEELARFQEEMGSIGSIEHMLALYQGRLLWFLDFLTRMRGKYETASFQEKRDALDVLGVNVVVHDPVYQEDLLETETWYTVKEAAKKAGLNRETIDTYIRSGRLIARVESERKRWIKGADLLALIGDGYGYHNNEKGVRARIAITYQPQLRGMSWETLQTPTTGVANYRQYATPVAPITMSFSLSYPGSGGDTTIPFVVDMHSFSLFS